ncbi:MAG: zinc transporter ZntB [Deltaproteobacteria bacterium]|jgi:zinc transporter|nr:zinc transporter ZntB [Deltaproteobacteria bacterium]MBW2496968.1 zinc transporter ZntB [Deltaproteobacteria bacterium]
MEEHRKGLIWALSVDPVGNATEIGWDGLVGAAVGGYMWIHLDLEAEPARRWLREESNVDEIAAEALLAEETRPRCAHFEQGMLLVLRGVNLNPGQEADDMVSLRLWLEDRRVISIRRRPVFAGETVRERLLEARGPESVGAFVVAIVGGLVEKTEEVVGSINDALDELEVAEEGKGELRSLLRRMRELRRQAIQLRRYIAPQRDALARFVNEPTDWLGSEERVQLRESVDHTTRFVEDLEAARERAIVIYEEIAARQSEELNQRMYALSIVAGLFLPLSFVTGLLGINVAGMWGVDTQWAFDAVILGLIALGLFEIVLFRRLKWL